MIKLRKIITYSFYIVFALIFSYILINAIFNNNVSLFKGKSFIIVIGSLINIVVLYFLHIFLKKIKIKHEKLIIGGIFAVTIIIQIIFGYNMCVNPTWDFGDVYRIAMESATSQMRITEQEYIYMYPNNVGIIALLKVVFKIAMMFGIDNFIFVGLALNAIFIDIALLITYLVVRKLFNKNVALFALILLCTFTPIYTYIPIFYTDTLSLPFVILPLYLYVLSEKPNLSNKHKFIYYLLIGIVACIGMTIKFTAIIVIIALLLTRIAYNKFSSNILPITIIVLVLIIFAVAKNLFINQMFNKETSDSKEFPMSHWIMMGLSNKGGYSEEDVQFTLKQGNNKEKEKASIEQIKKRIDNYLKNGELLDFETKKLVFTWGDGTYFAPEKLRREPIRKSSLHDFFIGNGKYYDIYGYYAQIQQITLLALLVISAVLTKYCEKENKEYKMIFTLTIAGVMMFFILWEARSRYLVNFIPILIILEVFGINSIYNFINAKKKKRLEVGTETE